MWVPALTVCSVSWLSHPCHQKEKSLAGVVTVMVTSEEDQQAFEVVSHVFCIRNVSVFLSDMELHPGMLSFLSVNSKSSSVVEPTLHSKQSKSLNKESVIQKPFKFHCLQKPLCLLPQWPQHTVEYRWSPCSSFCLV